jgi:hypothetical protein
VRLVRIEPGRYQTSCGTFEAWKMDDGQRGHGGPLWLLWRVNAGAKWAKAGHALSFREAKKKLEALVSEYRRGEV